MTCLCATTDHSFVMLLQTSMLLVKVNDTKSCFPPLVATKNEISWYPYVDGCGLQCENVLYTEADHTHAHIFILVMGLSCLFCTLFTVVGDACKIYVYSHYLLRNFIAFVTVEHICKLVLSG